MANFWNLIDGGTLSLKAGGVALPRFFYLYMSVTCWNIRHHPSMRHVSAKDLTLLSWQVVC